MTTWQELAERAEAATGPDDELVGRLMCAVEPEVFGRIEYVTGDDGSDGMQVYAATATQPLWSGYRSDAPDVSVDAMLSLIDATSPDAGWRMDYISGGQRWARIYPRNSPPASGSATSPALALLAAYCRARADGAGGGT